MCGVNGVFAYHYAANPVDSDELTRTRDYMAARGPDAAGLWRSPDERVGFGHRRLSIIDLSDNGAQPMTSANGRFVVTFNGEIYNYRALRAELLAQGHLFHGNSDTEVLLELYAAKGPSMVRDLRGMFAFAVWDGAERTLFLARDPYGIKPLYYIDDGWTFRFASQVKALLAGGAVSSDPDPAGQVGFYLFGHVPEPFTTHRAIRALPAGSTVVVDRIGAGAPADYHSIAEVYRDAETRVTTAANLEGGASTQLRAALLDSVRHHLVSDVPVGAFLSSGIDSSAIVGLMRDAGQQEIRTVTLSFAEFAGKAEDEAPLASEVARAFDTQHTTRRVGAREFENDLPRIFEAMDLPSIDGVNTWFVSKAARELGLKVAISGIGGDELFGGYPSFRDVPRWVRLLDFPARAPFFGRLARQASQGIVRATGANPKAAGMLEYGGTYAGAYLLKRALFMPWELGEVLPRDIVEEGLRRLSPLALIGRELKPRPSTPAACVATLESTLYMRSRLLRDTDWASMAHSIEVRTPLVDATLLRRTAEIGAAFGEAPSKSWLAEAPTRPLPVGVRSRAKTGFTTPVEFWQHRGALAAAAPPPSRGLWARTWASVVWNGPDLCRVA